MRGSTLRRTVRPRDFVGRLAFAGAVVLIASNLLQRPIVEPLIPAFRLIVPLLDNRFLITDARIVRLRAGQTVRLRVNLTRPVVIGDRVLYPFGSYGMPAGGFQVTYTVGGILQYADLLLIVMLSWPLRAWQECVARLVLAFPLVVLLVVSAASFTAVAELRNGLQTAVNLHDESSWIVWSRFLMGGGGLAAALVMGVGAVALSHWLTAKKRTAGVKAWRRVSRGEFDEFYRSHPRPLEAHPPLDQAARRYILRDRSLGAGPESVVAEWRRNSRRSVYRIRSGSANSGAGAPSSS